MWSAETIVAEIGAGRDGIITAGLVGARGVSDAAMGRLRRRGVIVSLGKGVDRLRDHPLTWRSRCRAALDLAGDGAVLGVRSAARLHGFYAYRSTEAVDVVVLRPCDSRAGIGRLLRTRWLPAEHITFVDGFPATTMARTFFDLCANPEAGLSYRHRYHEQRMKMVYNDALGRRGMTFTQEAAVLLVLARRGRTGTRLTRRILLHYGPKHEPTRSDAETLFLEVVRTHGLPDPERQGVIAGERGFIGTVDFVWRSRNLVVEIDSRWHDGPEDEERDLERELQLEDAGYTVKRYRYRDLVAHPERIARELGAILDGRPQGTAPRTEKIRGVR